MKTAIILHGKPSKEEYLNSSRASQSNSHWLPWLQQQLIVNGILAQTPELPEPYMPVYENWCKVFEQFKIEEDTILIGHSCGGGFLLRWLSENKINVGKVVLVAPWIDPTHNEIPNGFFNFEIDKDLIQRVKSIAVFISSDDDREILDTVEIIEKYLPQTHINNFENMGHFTFGDMKTVEFPELKNFVLE